MTKFNEFLIRTGIISIESGVQSGTKELNGLSDQILHTKNILREAIAKAILKKNKEIFNYEDKISTLKTEIEELKEISESTCFVQ